MQSNFTSMYNTGGQNYGSNQFAAQPQNPSAGFYPQWFPAYTGRQPMEVEQLLPNVFNQYLSMLYTNNIAQQSLGNIQVTGEGPALMNKVRLLTFVLLVSKNPAAVSKPTAAIIQEATQVVLIGEIIKRAGGPNVPIAGFLAQNLNINVVDIFTTYMNFEQNPNIYQAAIAAVEDFLRKQMAQQQQNQWGNTNPYGAQAGFNVPPSASAAVPSGNFGAMVGNVQPGFGGTMFAVGNPQQQTNDTINQIGRVAGTGSKSIYAIALEQQQNRVQQEQLAQQQQQAEVVKEVSHLNIPADNVSGVSDAFTLAAKIRKEGLKAFEAPVAAPAVEVEPTPEPVIDRPKSVIPAGWGEQAFGLNEPSEESSKPPASGLPSMGYYGFNAGEATTMDDFKTQPTPEQHSLYAPKPTRSFDDEAGVMEDDDFMNAVEQQIEADIQSLHEAERRANPLQTTSTMDELVQQGQEQGLPTNIEDQELRIDFGDLDSQSRKRICKQFHIRTVPAYVKGRDRIVQIMKGKRRTIVVERVENVKYEEHETEVVNSTPVFAVWDAAASDIGAARSVMSDAAAKPFWSSEVLLEKLDEKLKESENQDDIDEKLSELIAERSIIQIEGALTCTSPHGDYQGEVVTTLIERGVQQAGTILDNAIVEYERFESGCIGIDEVNENLIEAINEADTVIELITALNNFRQNATLPLREISRLHHTFTKYVNQYLKTEFSNGWGTTDPIEDQDELTRELLKSYLDEYDAIEIVNKLNSIYTTAARKAYRLLGIEADATDKTVGNLHKVVLLPIYYSQYPVATLDDVGAIQKADHPELYELLNKVQGEGKDIKIVTLDNYALTFVRSLGEDDLFYLVEVSN